MQITDISSLCIFVFVYRTLDPFQLEKLFSFFFVGRRHCKSVFKLYHLVAEISVQTDSYLLYGY